VTRNPKVWLADDVTRCVTTTCPRAHTCARALAPLPARYASVADFSVTLMLWCQHWIDAQTARAPSAAPRIPRRHGPLTP